MPLSNAKPTVSRRTGHRDRVRRYAELHRLSYSAAEERLIGRQLEAESILGEELPPEVPALFFGEFDGTPDWDDLERAWERWRSETRPPHTSWWAYWRFDKGLSTKQANARARAARTARVTERTGESWVETTQNGRSFVFWFTDTPNEDAPQAAERQTTT